jgi:hypothetical protein
VTRLGTQYDTQMLQPDSDLIDFSNPTGFSASRSATVERPWQNYNSLKPKAAPKKLSWKVIIVLLGITDSILGVPQERFNKLEINETKKFGLKQRQKP